MFKGLRARWNELTGKHTRFPPPALGERDATSVREAADRLFAEDAERYSRFFLFGQPQRVPRDGREPFEIFASCGLAIDRGLAMFAPCVRLFRLYGKLVATDLLSHADPDQVFSLMFEQVYLVRNMLVEPDDRVLELCVGSGVNSLFAADSARSVVGVDLSERALAFARFNRALNGADERIDLRQGSLFEPVASETFDLVLVNPPFELVPRDERWFLHSDGGEDGLDVVRKILADLPRHLAPAGRLEIITWSPGSAGGPELVALLRDALPEHRLSVDVLSEDPLDDHLDRFRESPGFDAWKASLEARGIDRVFFLLVRAAEDGPARIEVNTPEQEITDCHALANLWV